MAVASSQSVPRAPDARPELASDPEPAVLEPPELTPAAAPPRPALGHGLLGSFGFAWAGLAETALRDRNFRIHLALGALAAAVAAVAPLSGAGRALLLLCVAVVPAAEAANSALEAAVDLACPGHDERARIAKDAAAASVLALAAGSVLVAAAVVGPVLPSLLAAWPRLAPATLGSLATALAAGLLPAPGERALFADLALAAGGAIGLVPVALAAEAHAGTAAGALLLAIAADAARRKRR